MTAEARSVSVTSLGHVKMEERKRAAIRDPDDAVQPPKKTARVVNGVKNDDVPEWEPMVQVRLHRPEAAPRPGSIVHERRLNAYEPITNRSFKKTPFCERTRR